MPIQVQILTAFLVLRDRMDDAWRRVRDERGELTGSAIRTTGLHSAGRVMAGEPPRDGLHRRPSRCSALRGRAWQERWLPSLRKALCHVSPA